MKRLGLLTLLALLIVQCAFAGDNAQIDVIGFDGATKYFAFEQYGTQDGSGFPYSEIYFIEVATNEWAAKPVKMMLEGGDYVCEELESVRQQVRRKAIPTLRKLGLTSAWEGTKVLHDIDKDMGYTENSRKSFSFELGPEKLVINVKEKEVAGSDEWGLGPDQLLELTLKGSETGSLVLQKDKKLPASRKGARNYEICGVYTVKEHGALVALIGYHRSPGFEGPDKRYIAVSTGKLATGLE